MEIYGADINGIEGSLISFRTVKEDNKQGITVLGLASRVVREGVVRAQKAIQTLEGDWDVVNNQGYTFDLSPAEVPKLSSGLDLPIAIMLLQACILQNLDHLDEKIAKFQEMAHKSTKDDNAKKKIIDGLKKLVHQKKIINKYRDRLAKNSDKYLLIGKLDMVSGRLETPEHGMLSLICAAQKGVTVIVPEDSEIHASLVAKATPTIKTIIAHDLQEVWDVILGIKPSRLAKYNRHEIKEKKFLDYTPDLRAIEGVTKAKLAMRVALAGGHNILLVGPPGHGKTMLAEAATELLPNLDQKEMFEINKIYSAKGELKGNEVFLRRPFKSAENFTVQTLTGGGHPYPVPGLVSLAHRGVLFLDEINLCEGEKIDKLRTVISKGSVSVQRLHSTIVYPSNFVLIAAMNPCHDGWHKHMECPECGYITLSDNPLCPNDNARMRDKCNCSKAAVDSYKRKLSKPFLNRIDLKVLVSKFDESFKGAYSYASSTVKKEINTAREIQQKRFRNAIHITCNADVPDKSEFEKFEEIDRELSQFLKLVYKKFNISTPRMEFKVILVARTIADLEGDRRIKVEHIEQAIDLMGLNDPYFKDFA